MTRTEATVASGARRRHRALTSRRGLRLFTAGRRVRGPGMFLTVRREFVLQFPGADAEKFCSVGSALAPPGQRLKNVFQLESRQRQPWREEEALGAPRLLVIPADR